jgi:hypothetical protein
MKIKLTELLGSRIPPGTQEALRKQPKGYKEHI